MFTTYPKIKAGRFTRLYLPLGTSLDHQPPPPALASALASAGQPIPSSQAWRCASRRMQPGSPKTPNSPIGARARITRNGNPPRGWANGAIGDITAINRSAIVLKVLNEYVTVRRVLFKTED